MWVNAYFLSFRVNSILQILDKYDFFQNNFFFGQKTEVGWSGRPLLCGPGLRLFAAPEPERGGHGDTESWRRADRRAVYYTVHSAVAADRSLASLASCVCRRPPAHPEVSSAPLLSAWQGGDMRSGAATMEEKARRVTVCGVEGEGGVYVLV